MEKPFQFPLTMKNGKIYDSAGKDITEAYQQFKQEEAANQFIHALEVLTAVKERGTETRHLLFVDSAYKYSAVIETFIGDELSERLALPYAGRVIMNDLGDWEITKLNRLLLPIDSLAKLYSYVHKNFISKIGRAHV